MYADPPRTTLQPGRAYRLEGPEFWQLHSAPATGHNAAYQACPERQLAMAKQQQFTRETFLAALGKALWDIHQARRIRRNIGSALATFGISVPDDPNEVPTFTVPPENPADVYIGSGMGLSDLSDAKQAEYRATQLRQIRQHAYMWLQDKCDPNYGDYTLAEVTRHFDALGFPKPETETSVSATVQTGDTEVYLDHVLLAGSVDRDTVKAALIPHGSLSTAEVMANEAFPEAKNRKDTPAVHVSTRERIHWADMSEVN